eukprot:gene25247-33773_t
MIRSFDELNDILIDPTNVINHEEGEEIRSRSNSVLSNSTVQIEDQETRERGDDNSNYDEDFEEESPTKEAGAEYVEDYESDHTSISYQNHSFNELQISLPLAPSPPKKPETLDENKSPTIETFLLSPRAVRILKTDSERMSSPSNQNLNTDGNSFDNFPSTNQDENHEFIEISKPEISHPVEYTEKDFTGSPSFPHATPAVSIGKSRFSRPKLFSRVSVVSSSISTEIGQRRPTLLNTTPTASLPPSSDRNEMADIVRNILNEDNMKKLYAEELLHELQRRNAIPVPMIADTRHQARPSPTVESPAIRIPNYDRYYEICIEIQELVQRECEKEAKQRHGFAIGDCDGRTDNIDGVRSARRLQMEIMSFKGSSHNVDCQTSEQADSSPPFKVGKAKAKVTPKVHSPTAASVNFKGFGDPNPAPRRTSSSSSSSSYRNKTPPVQSPSSARDDRSLSTKATEFSESYKKRSTVSPSQFSTTLPSTTPSSSSSSSPPVDPAAPPGDERDDDVRSIDEFIDMMDKLRREKPKIFDACNNIYSTFLSDLIGVCKKRASDSSVEELAMHRKLSEFVTTAFAARSMQSIMTSMMQAAVDVAPPLDIAATNRKSVKNQPYMMDIQ